MNGTCSTVALCGLSGLKVSFSRPFSQEIPILRIILAPLEPFSSCRRFPKPAATWSYQFLSNRLPKTQWRAWPSCGFSNVHRKSSFDTSWSFYVGQNPLNFSARQICTFPIPMKTCPTCFPSWKWSPWKYVFPLATISFFYHPCHQSFFNQLVSYAQIKISS